MYVIDNGEKVSVESYTYDENGIRTSKTYCGVTTYFVTTNGVINAQYQLDDDGNVTNVVEFLYDENDSLIGYDCDEGTYFYVKNAQGDITNIVDENGVNLVNYLYYSYGIRTIELDLSATDYGYTRDEIDKIEDLNPFGYRGYYYDEEMALCYLQSRYYSPDMARFLNADDPTIALISKDEPVGTNLFAYCNNDPVNYMDYDGCDAIAGVLVTFAWPTVIEFFAVFATYFWAVVAIIAAVGITIWAINKIVQYAKNSSGKKAKDNSKNEPHGNESAKKKAEKQANELKDKAKKAKTKKERQKLLKKAKHVLENGEKQRKGETHHRK